MDLHALSKDELIEEFLRLNNEFLNYSRNFQLMDPERFRKVRDDLNAFIEELRRRRQERS